MKQIKIEQCNSILQLLLELNVPVRAYREVEALFMQCPDVLQTPPKNEK